MRYTTAVTLTALMIMCLQERGSAQTPPDPNADIIELFQSVAGDDSLAESVKLDAWPADTSLQVGFTFTQSDYETLDAYSVESDSTAVSRYPRRDLEVFWNMETENYWGTIARTVVLKNDSDKKLIVTIRVSSDHANAKRILARDVANQHELRSLATAYPVWGPDFDLAAGHILLLRDETREEGWEASQCRSLSFVQHNVLIDIRKDDGCEINLPSLAATMAELILVQEDQRVSESAPLKPTVSMTLSSDEINFPELEASGDETGKKAIGVSVTTSDWEGEVSTRAFVSKAGHPISEVTEQGEVVYDTERTIYRVESSELAFDNVADPTECTFVRTADGNWHIAVAVWGQNLVPAFAFEQVSIVRGK